MTFGTFYNCFCGRKTPNSRDYARDCPYPVANFSRQSNSLIYWKKLLPENYWAVFCDIWTIDRGDIGAYSIRKWGDSIWIEVCRNKTKLTFQMPVVQKLLDRFTWNFHRKCKSIQPLCLWNIKAIKIELQFWGQKIGKTYKNSSSFNTWVTVVKHSWIIASMSSNNRLF